jgi:predicted nucleotidyltransferase
MNTHDNNIIMEIKKRMPESIKLHIRKFIAYGSRVRGDNTADSDSDLDLIILVDNKTEAIEKILDDTAYEIMWDDDFKTIISLKVFSESRFNKAVDQGYSFYRNVSRDGISL